MAESGVGLDSVIVAQQDISFIDGQSGELIYRGYHIDELATNASFEEVVYLLWLGRLPNQVELNGLKSRLADRRALHPEQLRMLLSIPKSARPMSICRTGISMLGPYDPEKLTFDKSTSLIKAENILAKLPTMLATFERYRRDLNPIPPRDDLSHAANFLWMLTGKEPTPEAEKALDLYLILLAEHGFNASTFTCRVVSATWAGMYSAIVSGVGALSGPAHGGAVERAMEQFHEIGNVDNVAPWLEACQRSDRRVMGVGHRVYKTLDPRAPHLKHSVELLAEQSTERKWFDIASKLETDIRQIDYFNQKQLYPNVDYYSAPLLDMIGLETDMFTPMFAMARIAGWAAHIMAQYENNRLIRPRAEYIGPRGLTWTPIDERGHVGVDPTRYSVLG